MGLLPPSPRGRNDNHQSMYFFACFKQYSFFFIAQAFVTVFAYFIKYLIDFFLQSFIFAFNLFVNVIISIAYIICFGTRIIFFVILAPVNI